MKIYSEPDSFDKKEGRRFHLLLKGQIFEPRFFSLNCTPGSPDSWAKTVLHIDSNLGLEKSKSFRNICVSAANFRNTCQNISTYITKDHDTYTYITKIEKTIRRVKLR
jgi:hypothetical protein